MSNILIKLLSIALLSTVQVNCGFFGKEAKIEASVHYVRTCETDKDSRQILQIHFFKYNHTNFAGNVNLTLLEPFDKSYKLHIAIEKWADGGWKFNFLNIDRDDACNSFFTMIANVGREMQNAFGMKPGCPVEPGFYKMEDFSSNGVGSKASGQSRVDINNPFIVFPGIYHASIQFVKHRKIYTCFEIEVELKEYFDTY